MQPNDTFSTSRRALDVEDYIDILRRHKGWIFGPFLFALVVSVVGGYLWPDTYVSKGKIKVEPQQLALVQPVITQDMMDRINSMIERIESHDNLAQIVRTYNLYPKEFARLPLEDVLDVMKKQILIEPLGSQAGSHQVPAFAVSFSYPDRHLAQRVTQELITQFLQMNSSNLSDRTFESTQFMQDQADAARKELEAVESQLAAYKVENNGRLPEQINLNYQKLTSLETSESNLNAQITRLTHEKLEMESSLQLFTAQAAELAKTKDPVAAAVQQQQQKSVRLQRAEGDVENLQKELQVLQEKYRDTYPEVKTAKDFLAAALATRDQIAKEESDNAKKEAAPGRPGPSATASVKESQERETTMHRYQMSIAADENQIDDLKAQLKRVTQDIATLNTRLNSTPQSEKDYDDLVRERDLKKVKYEENTKNLGKAQEQQDMENKQYGEKFEILDAASLPDAPSYPPRLFVIAIGGGVGLIVGIIIAGAREVQDTSLKNLKDVRAYTQMTILGSIPLLENDFVVRRRRRLAWLGWTTACLTALVLMSGSVVYYISTKQ
jgi:polysaccharide chain length determinant protein (PEP-CTERM system associated)